MANLSDQTKLRITLATAGTIVLFLVGVTWNAAIRAAGYEARIIALETRQSWEAEDAKAVVAEVKTMRTDVTAIGTVVTRLSTQMEALLQQRSASARAPSQSRVIVTASQPNSVQMQPSSPSNPQQPNNPEQPEPQPTLLQPAVNVVQKILDDVGMLL